MDTDKVLALVRAAKNILVCCSKRTETDLAEALAKLEKP